ncbi:MAG: hypothetical protein ACN6OP_03345 [Pseudomonadales bacterium]|uniref:hypothetical protein n=1 Tax=Cupriavidus sp. YAF13 TaxID=3233075 RepID=UPI003DF49C72
MNTIIASLHLPWRAMVSRLCLSLGVISALAAVIWIGLVGWQLFRVASDEGIDPVDALICLVGFVFFGAVSFISWECLSEDASSRRSSAAD